MEIRNREIDRFHKSKYFSQRIESSLLKILVELAIDQDLSQSILENLKNGDLINQSEIKTKEAEEVVTQAKDMNASKPSCLILDV